MNTRPARSFETAKSHNQKLTGSIELPPAPQKSQPSLKPTIPPQKVIVAVAGDTVFHTQYYGGVHQPDRTTALAIINKSISSDYSIYDGEIIVKKKVR